jgi:CRISPR/Cas system-associated protein Cas10 (large subunit of type III CRISPR-Cas system)
MVSAFESFSPSDLRRITINTHYILHCINTRKSAILPWQNLFLRRFKEKNSYDENKENFERSEEIISRLIEEKSQEMQKSHSKMLEVLFLFLSAITIYSTYVDIASFLDTKHNNFSNINSNTLEIKLFISITIILGLVFAYVLKVKRKG